MKLSKRNPLLNNEEMNAVVGGLGEEMERQDLETVNGGGWGSVIKTTIKTTIKINNAVTKVAKCGSVLTVSAECRKNHKSCR